MAFPERVQNIRWAVILLEGAGGDTFDKLPLEKHIHQYDGQERDYCPGHHQGDVGNEAPLKEVEAYR